MRKKHELDDEEKQIFRENLRGVRPLSHTKITPDQKVNVAKKPRAKQEKSVNPLDLYESDYAPTVTGDEKLEFHRDGLQHKVLRNLRQGKYNAEAVLDMHGMRVFEAREALNEFLLYAKEHNIRNLLVIHGKGHGTNNPVLKNKINQWLRQIEFVLAFCSASPHEGSSGALYVLLKGR